jgi:hypothetical protein
VRGGGDPFLISEELAQLAPELVAAIGKEPVTMATSGIGDVGTIATEKAADISVERRLPRLSATRG